jgi:hypothetical protein
MRVLIRFRFRGCACIVNQFFVLKLKCAPDPSRSLSAQIRQSGFDFSNRSLMTKFVRLSRTLVGRGVAMNGWSRCRSINIA